MKILNYVLIAALVAVTGHSILLSRDLKVEREWNRSFDQRLTELKIQANQTEVDCISELYRGTPNLRGN